MAPSFSDDDASDAEGTATPQQLLAELRRRLLSDETQVAELFGELRQQVDAIARQVAEAPQRPAPAAASVPVKPEPIAVRRDPLGFLDQSPQRADAGGLEALIFGPELCGDSSLAGERERMLADMAGGEPAALTLGGAIVQFRGATVERMPQLLKDIGEAWYAWQPHSSEGPDPLRDTLTRWLERKCDAAGVPNTIELVRPGDRFDSKRHHARQPGVEVIAVGGWVVLRDNGKVYTKATVTVK
jgi:hypothetical protein